MIFIQFLGPQSGFVTFLSPWFPVANLSSHDWKLALICFKEIIGWSDAARRFIDMKLNFPSFFSNDKIVISAYLWSFYRNMDTNWRIHLFNGNVLDPQISWGFEDTKKVSILRKKVHRARLN